MKVSELRRSGGLSQKDVSLSLVLSISAFANYEQGIREPSLDVLRKICLFFEVSADYLLDLPPAY